MYSNKFVLELIKDAINDELMSNKYYSMLANSMRDVDDKKTLEQISLDEKKHFEMFMDIYRKLTNEEYTPENVVEKEIDSDIMNSLINSMKAELDAVEAYRPILFAIENSQLKNYLTEIITDEQNHAAKLNFMYSKNK